MNEFFTYAELAKILKVKEITLRTWVKQEKIPYYRLGPAANSPIRFDLKEIRRWLRDKHKVKARPAYVRQWDKEIKAG